ncbi:unknown [Bacteroides sp. CAG:633]|nr:unknown [Bacteroides sp. CAG:633]
MHTYHLGAAAQRGDGDEGVVQCCDEKDRQAQCQHDGEHASHVVLLAEGVAQGFHPGTITPTVTGWQIFFGHLFHTGIEGFHIHPGAQTHVLKVGVAAVPRVVHLLGGPGGRQGDDGVGPHGRIVWQVGIRTAYSQIAFVIVADDLSDGVFTAEHPLCQTLTQVNYIGLLKILHGIAAQHFDTHRLEEERIGAQLGFVETGITVIQRPRSQIAVGAGGRFYFFRKVFQNGTCQRSHVHVLGFILFTVHDELAPHLIKPVVVAEACVVTLLVGHAGKEQDAHGKSQT